MIDAAGDSSQARAIARVAWVLATRMAAFAEWVLAAIEANPRRVRVMLAALLLVGAVSASKSHPAAAGVILDPILTGFQKGTNGWMTGAITLAQAIFLSVGLIMGFYTATSHYAEYKTFKGMPQSVLKLALGLALPYVVMTALSTALNAGGGTGVNTIASQLAGKITGHSYGPLTPDGIMLKFLTIGWTFPTAAGKLLWNTKVNLFELAPFAIAIILLVLSVLIAIVVLGVGVFLAVEFTLATVQALFALPLAAWTLGFAASPATASIAAAFYQAVLKIVVRVAAIYLVIGFADGIADGWATNIASRTFNGLGVTDVGVLKPAIEFMLGALALAYVVKDLPKHAVSALTGAPVITVGGLASSASGAVGGASGATKSAAGGAGNVDGKQSDFGAAAKGASKGGFVGAAAAVVANRIKR